MTMGMAAPDSDGMSVDMVVDSTVVVNVRPEICGPGLSSDFVVDVGTVPYGGWVTSCVGHGCTLVDVSPLFDVEDADPFCSSLPHDDVTVMYMWSHDDVELVSDVSVVVGSWSVTRINKFVVSVEKSSVVSGACDCPVVTTGVDSSF